MAESCHVSMVFVGRENIFLQTTKYYVGTIEHETENFFKINSSFIFQHHALPIFRTYVK